MSRVHLAVGVVSTWRRRELLGKTLAALDDGEWVEVITDQAVAATANMLAAWQVLAEVPRATHALLLHDDLNASRGWRSAATSFAARFPGQQLTAFYTPRLLSSVGRSGHRPGYVLAPTCSWSDDQAVMMPVAVVRRYLRWVAAKEYRAHLAPQDFLHHDRLLATFHQHAGARMVHLVDPPVFQHMGDGRDAPNQSREWRGREFDVGTYFRRELITV